MLINRFNQCWLKFSYNDKKWLGDHLWKILSWHLLNHYLAASTWYKNVFLYKYKKWTGRTSLPPTHTHTIFFCHVPGSIIMYIMENVGQQK